MTIKSIFINVPLAICIILWAGGAAMSYDNRETHPSITKVAIENASLNQYLVQNVGIENGVEAKMSGIGERTISDWIRKGSVDEDLPACRASNHFHDPLSSWDTSFMSDDTTVSALVIRGFCNATGWPFTMRKSNVTWATGYTSPSPDGEKDSFAIYLLNSPFNWDKTREAYHKALTAITGVERNSYFAKTFENIGHVLHLLQDVSVPAHTRNDFQSHLIKNGGFLSRIQPYENYVKINSRVVAVANPIGNFPIFSHPSITDFWDTDRYTIAGNQPSGLSVGLSEFSNGNYFSDYTIFNNGITPEHSFPFPHVNSADYQVCYDLVPSSDYGTYIYRKYISRKDRGVCPEITSARTADHFAAVSILDEDNVDIAALSLVLDDNVHKTYARELIPRAIGYSAALLNYFFRGSIEISLPRSAMYASTGNRDLGFTRITLLALNNTSNGDEMTDGTIELVAKYRRVAQDPFRPVDLQASNEYSYVVAPEATGKRTISRGTPTELVFDLGSSAIIPVDVVDISLQVVYHGRLGNEDGAVAVGLKSISDPTPVELINNMDKICLNETWYQAGSADATAQVDPEHDGVANWDIYPHDLQNVYIMISSADNPVQASASDYTFMSNIMNPGILLRAYVLSDYGNQINHSHIAMVMKANSLDTFTHKSDLFNGIWTGYTVKSVVETSSDSTVCSGYGFSAPCAIRHAPPFYSFRGNYLWGPTATILDNPEYPAGKKCDWQTLH